MDILKITKPSVCLFILSILLLAFTGPLISSIWSISETVLNNAQDSTKDYGQGFQTIGGDITSGLNKAGNYMQGQNPNIGEMKANHEYHTQSDLKNYILSKNLTRDQAKTLVDSLINSGHIIEGINEAPLPQYRINLAHSILGRILARGIRDFGFTMGEYAMGLGNLGVGTMNGDLYIFMKGVLGLSLSIICTFILVTALSIFIKYISFSLKIFPRLFLNILGPIKSKLLALSILILPPILMSSNIFNESSFLGVLIDLLIFIVNVLFIWILISTINDLAFIIRSKKLIDKIKLWLEA